MKLLIKAVKSTKKQADELAEKYFAEDANVKMANTLKNEVTERIKGFARVHGKLEKGKTKLVRGKKYAVGFTQVDPTPTFDPELAMQVLPLKIRKDLMKTVTIVDEGAFAKAVEAGVISEKLALQCCRSRQGYQRIAVFTVQDLEKWLQEASNTEGD